MPRTGADLLVETLVDNGIDTCFANPGTTEMHLLTAMTHNRALAMHLCLFEGVATGAADGYARMSGKPAATLLHLGPGLANGVANLHNAKKADTPVFNVIGEHAIDHIRHNAPLTSDIEGIARPVSRYVETARSADEIGDIAASMLADMAGPEGGIGTLVAPNDVVWSETSASATRKNALPRPEIDRSVVGKAIETLRNGETSALVIGAPFISARSAYLSDAISRATGCTVLAEAAVARMQRGDGTPALERIPFHVDLAVKRLKDIRSVVLAGARDPVAFFAYPGRPSRLLPDGAEVLTLSAPRADLETALEAIAAELGVTAGEPQAKERPALPPSGAITPESLGQLLANRLPDNAIVVDESITSGAHLYPMCAAAGAHDWLTNRGGSIGFSLPVAVGCAVACPDRKVITLTGDGSAFYTLQALWTMARSSLDILVIIMANRSYRILNNEMSNIGAGAPDADSAPMISLTDPEPDWVSLARGHGVEAKRVETTDEFASAFDAFASLRGPRLIEAVL